MHQEADFNPRSREGSDGISVMDYRGIVKFQSTLPRRERRILGQRFRAAQKFQSTLPRRERRFIQTMRTSIRIFQSTLPRRERLVLFSFYMFILLFQSTLPRRERHRCTNNIGYSYNFNPRSREGSDKSIHKFVAFWFISIHAPAKGATKQLTELVPAAKHFNPRSREGSD